ncbi:hypothetical protein C8J57DRAFT_1526273 [Mycena rebaudengoi]|nr:hypothetical protein C8J57DRAFT_1526273 [Mycena rebaudengoi]
MHVVVKSRWSSSFVFAMHIVVKISSLCSWSLCEGPSSPAIPKADASATVFVRPLDFTMHVVVKSRWSSSFVFAMYIVVKISSLCSWSLREPLRAVHIADDSNSDDGVTYFCENCDPCPVCLAPPKASPSQAATQATPPPSPVDGHRWPVPRAIPITVPFVIFLTEAYFLGGWKQLVLPYVIGTIVCLL